MLIGLLLYITWWLDIPLWITLTVFILIILYWYGTWNHNFFKGLGIPGPKPWPFIGVNPARIKANLYTIDAENIKKYGKVFGYFLGTRPEMIVADHDIINEIVIKQFHNFTSRRPSIIRDNIFKNNLTVLTGERWKSTRSHMSPTFTTGKLRKMAGEINRSARLFSERLKSLGEPFEAKTYSEAYAMDCIASTAFGIRIDSQNDTENEFNIMGKRLVDFNVRSFKFLFTFLAPPGLVNIFEALGYDTALLDQTSTQFFVNVIDKTIQGRSTNNKERADFLQLMVNALEGEDIHDETEETESGPEKKDITPESTSKKALTKEDILSNAFIFFFAGYDTVSIALTQLMYLLACNQEAQNKLLEEVDETIGNMEDVSYDVSVKMHYLDQCINETLRLYPPAFRTDRTAGQDTEICGVKFKKGVIVNIPILAIHYDPDIWPEPEKFDPERFAPDRKASIKPTHFMPFGLGPRSCIGMRQALYEIKIAMIHLLQTHRLVTCEKTEIPLEMSKTKIMKSLNGVWLTVEKRK